MFFVNHREGWLDYPGPLFNPKRLGSLLGIIVLVLTLGCGSEGSAEPITLVVVTSTPTALVKSTSTPLSMAIQSRPSPVLTATLTQELSTSTQELPTSTPIPDKIEETGICTLSGGEVVQKGWSGKDTGHNYCNQCMCMGAGLACTKMACPSLDLTPTSTHVPTTTKTSTPTVTFPLTPTQTPVPMVQSFVEWSNWETGEWIPNSTPPKCGPLEEMFDVVPIDVSIVNEFGRPGREGGNGSYYVAHGYLRPRNTPHDQIEVKFPADGFSLYAVNRRVEDYYIEEKETDTVYHIADDEEQVKLEFHHPCGIKIMLDHLAQVTNRWAEIIKDVPVLTNDSRVTFMGSGEHFVEAGEVLAHAIGHATNTYLDFGVYDLRTKNQSAEMLARDWPEYVSGASHGVCWTGLFGQEVQKTLEDLTAGSVSTSDFCE